MKVRILAVCTGNICRSPLATQLLRQQLNHEYFEVESAGVKALVNAPMDAKSRRIAQRLGVTDAGAHVARQLTKRMLVESDLVLALDRDRRRQIAQVHPASSRNTFTLREFARLARSVTDLHLAFAQFGNERPLRGALAEVNARRGTLPLPADPTEHDVIDPYRQPMWAYEQSTAEITDAVDAIVDYFSRALSKQVSPN